MTISSRQETAVFIPNQFFISFVFDGCAKILLKIVVCYKRNVYSSGQREENFCVSTELQKSLEIKMCFCRNTERTERGSFYRKGVFLQK